MQTKHENGRLREEAASITQELLQKLGTGVDLPVSMAADFERQALEMTGLHISVQSDAPRTTENDYDDEYVTSIVKTKLPQQETKVFSVGHLTNIVHLALQQRALRGALPMATDALIEQYACARLPGAAIVNFLQARNQFNLDDALQAISACGYLVVREGGHVKVSDAHGGGDMRDVMDVQGILDWGIGNYLESTKARDEMIQSLIKEYGMTRAEFENIFRSQLPSQNFLEESQEGSSEWPDDAKD